MGDLVHICTGFFAEGGDRIDGGDTLREEGVRSQFGELRRPEVGGEHLLRRDPLAVDISKVLHRLVPVWGQLTTDEDAVWLQEIIYCCALCEELRVGEDLKADAVFFGGVGREDCTHGIGSLHGNGRFLDDNLGRGGDLCDLARCELPVREICSGSSSNTRLLCWGVDGDEYDVRIHDRLLDISGEDQAHRWGETTSSTLRYAAHSGRQR